ncbi:MAG: hypothetical protein IIV86_02185 [Bacteroidaceae bacterium]|nr:hypothetical protein [Bacteroidaceae bacterium]
MKMYNLLLGVVGVGVGVVATMCMCRYARTAQGEKMRRAMERKLREGNQWAEQMVERTRHKAMEVGVETADMLSHKAHDAAERMQRHMNAVGVE